MLFEVYLNGKRMMWTEYAECIPSEEAQKAMRKAGCRIKNPRPVLPTPDGERGERNEVKQNETCKTSISRGARKSKGA